MAELRITTDKVGAIIEMARQIQAQTDSPGRPLGGRVRGDDSGDDSYLGAMEGKDGQLFDQLRSWAADFAPDEIADILALQRLGRGDYDVSEWEDAQRRADEDVSERGMSLDRILNNDPQLADFLESAVEMLGYETPDDVDVGTAGTLREGPDSLR